VIEALWPEAREQGFTLLEVLLALALVASTLAGVAALFGVAVQATRRARDGTWTTTLAVQKLEQLGALTWSFDAATGERLTDTTSDLTRDLPATGGPGLRPSPTAALVTNTTGYVDFLDAEGHWVGTGVTPPANAVYVRRWSVQPLAAEPDDGVAVQVLVATVADRMRLAQAGGDPATRLAADTLLTTVRMRTVR
jgi:prepilin-type N-terminal cleavage/methylation domain-containing protein